MFNLPHKTLFQSVTVFLLLFFVVLKVPSALAQTPISPEYLALSTEYIVVPNSQNLPEGSLISLREGQYAVTTEEYSKDLFGVVTVTPAVEIQPDPIPANAHPVVRSGEVNVIVNGESGPIKRGDLVTSSNKAGQAMKAQKSGFIVGVAQADFSPTSPGDTALIPVLIDVKFAFAADAPESQKIVSRLMSVVSLSTISLIEEPVKSLKYIVAGLCVLLTLVISFLSFGRVAYKGVEALGRNPLAKNSIMTGIVINTVLGLGLAASGLAIAYIIVTW